MSRNLDFEDDADKGTKGNEEHVIRKYRKRNPCYAVAESLATLLPSVTGKAGYVLRYPHKLIKLLLTTFLLFVIQKEHRVLMKEK